MFKGVSFSYFHLAIRYDSIIKKNPAIITRLWLILLFIFAPISSIGQVHSDTVSYNNVNISPGSFAPNFIAQDENSKSHRLSDLRGKQNLILIFFRGYW